jgi:hypothetical protein
VILRGSEESKCRDFCSEPALIQQNELRRFALRRPAVARWQHFLLANLRILKGGTGFPIRVGRLDCFLARRGQTHLNRRKVPL